MLKYFRGHELDRSGMASQVWQFRHRHFVERFGWEALRKPNGFETDEFDDDEAIHLVLEHQGAVLGYSRLLRSDRPHLLSHVYPELVEGFPYDTGPDTFEWTRCVAEPDAHINGVMAAHILQTGVLEFCLAVGIRALIVETHPKLVQVLISHRWHVVPIAAPTLYDGALVLPINAAPTFEALSAHRDASGINGSVLDLPAMATNPIDGTALKSFIEKKHIGHAVEARYA